MAKLLTVAEAAAELKVSKGKVYRMTWSGELYTKRIGRAVRIPEESIHSLTNLPSGYVSTYIDGDN
jgi:excisionase family DNA binding protein